MISGCIVTALADNPVHRVALLAEHGAAFLVEADGLKSLLATAPGLKQHRISVIASASAALCVRRDSSTGSPRETKWKRRMR